jgi:S1-C subfamily serine protease
VDLDGLLVGINTAIASEGGGYDGICFATPVSVVRPVVEALLRDGKIVRPWIGIRPRTLDHNAAARFGLAVTSGVMVDALHRGSPAHQAALQPGDVITQWEGREVNSAADLSRLIQATPIGSQITLTIVRGDQTYRGPVTIRERPQNLPTGGVL